MFILYLPFQMIFFCLFLIVGDINSLSKLLFIFPAIKIIPDLWSWNICMALFALMTFLLA